MVKGSPWRLTIVLLCGVFASCTSFDNGGRSGTTRDVAVIDASARGATPGTGDVSPELDATQPSIPRPTGAVAYLVEEARALRAAGQFEQAAAQIERAMRIERNNAWLFLDMARIKFESGDKRQGEAWLSRALAVAGDDPAIGARAQSMRSAMRDGSGLP